MDKKIRNISQDIQNSKLLDENIPCLFNYLSDRYQVFAEVRLALHYFTFYESYYDDENTWSMEASIVIAKLNHAIRDNVLKNQSGEEREKAIHEVDTIRQNMITHMNALTTYTDVFQNYEYVLNRLEYRFLEETASVDEVEFSKEVLRYIFDSEDNLIINEKIKEVIGQLPIRFTKQKYFEIIKASLEAYQGADGSSLDSFLYMLRTSAMLYHEEGMEDLYPDLWEKKEYLYQLDYKNITKENYEKAKRMLQAAAVTLETETSVYLGLQEIINEVYSLLLCSSYSGMVASEAEEAEKAALSIISKINELFLEDEKTEFPDELMEQFTELEGIQETLSFEIEIMENALYSVSKNHSALVESLMLGRFMQVLLRCQSLMSNSLFIDLDEKKEAVTVDKDRIEKEANALIDELTNLFNGLDRMICRAVIANTINKVPVFFNDHKEVMDYVRYSFDRCSDIYEKSACIEILNDIMKA